MGLEREPSPLPPPWALGASIVHRAPGQPMAVSWQDVMLMGDFNADCSYVTSSQWSSIRLRTSSTFQWLIPDSADTTATSTNCAYDR